MLTPAQRDHYRAFGYVILRGYYSGAEVAELRAQLIAQLEREHPNLEPDPSRRDFCCMLGSHNTAFHGLLEDPRFLDVADELHGRSVPVWCDGNRYAIHDTGWHADILLALPDALEHAGIKFIHYLEPLRANDGALRVVPGSHARPLHDRVADYLKGHWPAVKDMPSLACETDPGDVVAFHHGLYHAAAGVRAKRLMHTLAYYPRDSSREFVAQVAELYRSETLHVTRRDLQWQGEVYPASWIAGASHIPRRRDIVARMREAGILDAMGADAGAVAQALDHPLRRSA